MNGKVSPDYADYVRRREAQERAAAKQASTLAARRAHQELAQLYAKLAVTEISGLRATVGVVQEIDSLSKNLS